MKLALVSTMLQDEVLHILLHYHFHAACAHANVVFQRVILGGVHEHVTEFAPKYFSQGMN